MAVISWRSDVNKGILDSTSITMGDGGVKTDSSDIVKNKRATALNSGEKFSVTMDFDWLTQDENGNTEYDKFQNWYRYEHCFGINPFWFPSLSQFKTTGTIEGADTKEKMCQYRITSAPSFQKSGFCMRCTMTWEEVYNGIIQKDISSSSNISKWDSTVNTIISDATSLTMGTDALNTENSDNGYQINRQKNSQTPETYSVTMLFDWLNKDSNNKSEFDRFREWYKLEHQYGARPFEFNSISKYNIYGTDKTCYYRITSAPSFSKEGFNMRCTMTWEEYYSHSQDIETSTSIIDHVEAENGCVTLVYTEDAPGLTGGTPSGFSGIGYVIPIGGTSKRNTATLLTVKSEYLCGKKDVLKTNKIPESGTYIVGLTQGKGVDCTMHSTLVAVINI